MRWRSPEIWVFHGELWGRTSYEPDSYPVCQACICRQTTSKRKFGLKVCGLNQAIGFSQRPNFFEVRIFFCHELSISTSPPQKRFLKRFPCPLGSVWFFFKGGPGISKGQSPSVAPCRSARGSKRCSERRTASCAQRSRVAPTNIQDKLSGEYLFE